MPNGGVVCSIMWIFLANVRVPTLAQPWHNLFRVTSRMSHLIPWKPRLVLQLDFRLVNCYFFCPAFVVAGRMMPCDMMLLVMETLVLDGFGWQRLRGADSVPLDSQWQFGFDVDFRENVGFHKWGPPKWMVYNGKSFYKMDDVGVSLFQETSKCLFGIGWIGW